MTEVDASIPLSIKPIQLDNPMDIQAKSLQLRNLGLQTQTAQQDFNDNQTLRALYQKHVNPDGTVDTGGLLKDVYGAGLAKPGMALQKTILDNRKTNADIDESVAKTGQATASASQTNLQVQHEKSQYFSNALGSLISKPDLNQQDVINQVTDARNKGYIDDQTAVNFVRNLPGTPQGLKAVLIQKAQELEPYHQQISNQIATAPQLKDTGGALTPIDPTTGAPTGGPAVPKTMTPGEISSAATAAARLKFDQAKQQTGGLTQEALENAYQQFKVTGETPNSGKGGAAQQGAYANYFAKRAGEDGDPGAAQAARRVQFHASQGVVKDFESGQTSKDLTSLNTSIKHVGVLEPLIDSLGNTDMKFVNKVKNMFSDQFGGTAPNDFNTVRDFVTGEISKAALPSGGDATERDSIKQAAQSSRTPEQLKHAVGLWEDLLAGKTDAIRNKWDVGTNGVQGSFDKFLLPETKAALGKHGLGQSSPDSPAAPVVPPTSGWGAVQVTK